MPRGAIRAGRQRCGRGVDDKEMIEILVNVLVAFWLTSFLWFAVEWMSS